MPGTNLKSSNLLDLKNPFFRYTGVTQAPPQSNTASPSDTYWNQTDPTGGYMLLYTLIRFKFACYRDINKFSEPFILAHTIQAAPQQNTYTMNTMLNGGNTMDVMQQSVVEPAAPHQTLPIGK